MEKFAGYGSTSRTRGVRLVAYQTAYFKPTIRSSSWRRS
jgi:hypothetical protein